MKVREAMNFLRSFGCGGIRGRFLEGSEGANEKSAPLHKNANQELQ
jgi:hypothetical protein